MTTFLSFALSKLDTTTMIRAIGVTAVALFILASVMFVLGVSRPARSELLPLPKSPLATAVGCCAPMNERGAKTGTAPKRI